MKYTDIMGEIKQENIQSLYISQLEDTYFIEQLIELLKNQLGSEVEHLRYDLLEDSLESVLVEADAYSFFAEKKLLILSNPTFLNSGKKNETLHKKWIEYIQNPNPDTVLLVLLGGQKLDKRLKVVKQTLKEAVIVEEDKLDTKYYQRLITSLASPLQIEYPAIQKLITMTGGKVSLIQQEVEKLKLYASDQLSKIGCEQVEAVVAPTLEHHLFEMSNNLLNRQLEEALNLYHELLLQGEDTIKLNYLMIIQFRLYVQVSILLQRHYSLKEIASTLKVHPYRVELAAKQVKNQSLNRLMMIYNDFINADDAMKSSSMSQTVIFELLLTHLGNE